jgi:integrase
MARTIRDARLETRTARARLTVGRNVHWRTLVPGKCHLGYRRRRADLPGQWLVRHYKGNDRYAISPLGLADDFDDNAMTFAQAQKAALARRAPTSSKTVADAVVDYVAWLRAHRAAGTADDAAGRARNWIIPELGAIKLGELKSERISAWLIRLAAAPALTRGGRKTRRPPGTEDEIRARRATANRALADLRAALNQAFRAGHVADDSAWRRVRPFGGAEKARQAFLSLTEARQFIAAADPATPFGKLVMAALLTGARYSELGRLKVGDLNGGKVHVARSKSGRARDIVLSDEGARFFADLAANRGIGESLLPRSDGEPWRKSQSLEPMHAACIKAGIRPLGIHQLRHSYASNAIMAGMPLTVLARNLGHVDTKMVEKHYGHLLETYIDEQIRRYVPQFGTIAQTGS